MSQQHLKRTMSALLILSGLSSCTKSLPFQTQLKPQEVSNKSLINAMDSQGNGGSEYIYVASSDSSSRNAPEAAGAMPYWQGQEKRVKFKFTETALQVLEVDSEDRYSANSSNKNLVMSIPVDHIQYRCAEDRRGNCQNKEEENKDISWDQRSQFIPKFDSMKVVEANLLPIEMDQVFGQSCYTEKSARFINYKLSEDALNVQVEKVFQGDASCLSGKGAAIESLSDLTTTIVYHYSFVRKDKLVSSDYKPVSYRVDDQGTFGFFKTDVKKLDVDANDTVAGQTQYMNRWNPNRKSVTYYLSKEFNKPENKALVGATQKAFNAINTGLAKAGVDLKFNLEASTDKAPGDIRNSMIVLVEDPMASGPLGYGPTVSDPTTGEIVSGRVVMYLGNLLQSIKYTYEDIVKQQQYEKKKAAQAAAAGAIQTAPMTTNLSGVLSNQKQNKLALALRSNLSLQKALSQKKLAKPMAKASSAVSHNLGQQLGKKDLAHLSKKEINQIMNTSRTNNLSSGLDYISAMSKYCNYPSELFNFNDAIKKSLHEKVADLKPWDYLSKDEKQAVIDIVVPEVWVPILVHELGHNLGFRHNFKGSEDKDNFYSTDELTQMGVTYPIHYSSVMDYALSDLNALPTLGKYDIAALKFGYRREVETTDGKILKLDSDLQDLNSKMALDQNAPKLKDYGYCTDEYVDVNPGCKRFDEGTSVTDIVKNLIGTYEEYYSIRNFRNGRPNFSLMNDARYAGRIESTFMYIRGPKERYEDIKATYGLDDDSVEWTKVAWLKDLKEATILSGQFFTDVIQMPDVSCALAKTDAPNVPIGFDLLSNFDPDATSCFNVKLKPGYMILGQTGKFFNSKKDRSINEPYESYADQIDIRGIWIDKVLAANMLFARKVDISNYDEVLDSYLDIKDQGLNDKILKMVNNMVMNTVTQDLVFKTASSDSVTIPAVHVEVFGIPGVDPKGSLSHFIPAALSNNIGKVLGISSDAQSFQKVLLEKMTAELTSDPRTAADAQPIADAIQVYKMASFSTYQPEVGVMMIDVNSNRYLAMPKNSLAMGLIQRINLNTLLDKMTPEQALPIVKARMEATDTKPLVVPTEATAEEKQLYEAPLELVAEAAKGELLPSVKLGYILSILPNAFNNH